MKTLEKRILCLGKPTPKQTTSFELFIRFHPLEAIFGAFTLESLGALLKRVVLVMTCSVITSSDTGCAS